MAEKKNVSSGAEKAEKLTRKGNSSAHKKVSAEQKEIENLASNKEKITKSAPAESKGAARKKSAGKAKTKSAAKEKKIKERKQKKEQRAKLAAEKKQARMERKLEHKEKKAERKAALKEKRAERKEKRKERRDILKKESKQARRERIAKEKQAKREERRAKHEKRIAERKAKREHDLRVRAQKRAEREDRRRTPGFGGWLAAVISLGVTSLALATIVTFGWMNMTDMQANMAGGYTQSLYELNSVIDDLDVSLARAKASSSNSDRVRAFADIALESENAETILERFPMEIERTEKLSAFINNMGSGAKGMLYTAARGGELSAAQVKSLNYMYETNALIKQELNKLMQSAGKKDMIAAMSGKNCAMGECFDRIQNEVIQVPEGIEEGPFAQQGGVQKTARALEGQNEITAQEAERLAGKFFKDYKVSEANCTGEAVGQNLSLYNVNLSTPYGEMLAQISKTGGMVVSFDSFKECSENNFSIERCEDIAEDFLSSLGYDNLKPVWVSENGTTCNLTFVPTADGALLYSDKILVKVCEERGIVTGLEAIDYVTNHGERKIARPALSEKQARSAINGNIEVSETRKAVIPFDGEEKLCYEFYGSLDGNAYFVYVDAITGEELEVLTVVGTAQGSIIK